MSPTDSVESEVQSTIATTVASDKPRGAARTYNGKKLAALIAALCLGSGGVGADIAASLSGTATTPLAPKPVRADRSQRSIKRVTVSGIGSPCVFST